ncbi:amino acid ABC transporter substrate-binding protein [Pseudoroseomonas wenyumeiae]|uniref:Amino acid ABC transporter substrate-binding protein n=1 Tax=Teichococcus wenyumeiae TaxID=2478470 RepID=A0A3A9JCJ9_9PROT|nr:amino acid ABC transporter substrate-binding protein [Pseudoroseomonas wenyumeiae]RKK03161.1 amino acid ABC transporter substrate-binding protein [Pseudoroseomonas wenyumeiae]RMI27138.1 amino acid ABC transporter substrate-binding protein [Pseudoroseomonas wenyumeiae]
MRALASACLGGLATILAAVAAPAAAQPATDMVAAIRARGALACGVTPSTVGFATPGSDGRFRGLDADYCRAIATALLGDAEKARIQPTTTQQRFTQLQSGEIDVLSRVTTWTLAREASLGLAFAAVNVYDGQGFIVKKSAGVTSAKQLDGASICMQPGSTTELNAADWFRTNNLRMTPVLIEDIEEARKAFFSGRCDAYSTDATSLAALRYNQGANAEQFVVLPEIISKEPLGVAIRKGDWRFYDIVRWTHFALLAAEEMGLTSANIDSQANSTNPDVQRFLGKTGDLGKMMGLEPDWAVRVVKAVGNYGEIWDRNLAPLGIQRGINNIWTKGGLHYAPPMR